MLPLKSRNAVWILNVLCCFILAFCCFGPGIAAGAQTQPTTLSITTHEVLLDVLVTDAAGHPVTGLTAKDFTVKEEGTVQEIRRLEEHTPMTEEEFARLNHPPVEPLNTFTNYTPVVSTDASTVILLDAMDTPLSAQMLLRQQVIDYLKKMKPGAVIAIFQMDTQMRLIQGFTSDPQVLLAAAKSKRDMPSVAKPIPGDFGTRREIRMDILNNGMQSMGRYLAGYPGRKNLIWFTGQVPMSLFGSSFGSPFGDSFSINPTDIDDMTGDLTLNRVAVYPIDSRGLEVDPQFSAAQRGAPARRSGQRFESEQFFNRANLDEVAAATGGKAYYNTNGLASVIAEVVNNGSNYYTIAYATTNRKWNGQYQHIRVTVDRPDVHLQCRDGYYANSHERQEQNQIAAIERRQATAEMQSSPMPGSGPAAENPQGAGRLPYSGTPITHLPQGGFQAAMALGAIPPTEIVFTTNLQAEDKVIKVDKDAPLPKDNYLRAPWQNKPFRNYNIRFRAEVLHMQTSRTPDGVRHGSVEFVAVVYDAEGTAVNSISRTISFDMGREAYLELLQRGLTAEEQIAVPVKGNYFLRLGVRDIDSGRGGAFEIPVDQVKLGADPATLPGQ
jgi:VWFA-related protein